MVQITACTAGRSDQGSGGDAGDGGVTVFAASSLTAAFTELGAAFEAANPRTPVTFSFAASSEIAAQVREGAPVDVIATADQSTMATLTEAAAIDGAPRTFATNVATIMVAPGNPAGIDGLEDLADDELIVVLCAPEVPCGSYAARIIANAGVTITPKSLEENVKGVVAKVTLGEADAGIVYRTDVIAAGDAAAGIEIPATVNVVADYPIAAVRNAPNQAGAAAFIEFVISERGQEILASFGFGAP
jgi:molybdate transport system substrate-binding protein